MEAKTKRNLMYGAGVVVLAGILFFVLRKPATSKTPPPPVKPSGTNAPSQKQTNMGVSEYIEEDQEFGTTNRIPDYSGTNQQPPMPTVATAIGK